MSSLVLISCQNNHDILSFESSNEKIVSEFFDENTSQIFFLTTTPKKELYSISTLKGGELVPIAFYSENETNYILYDLNGELKIEHKLEKNIRQVNIENDFSFDGKKVVKINFSNARSEECMGGSTWNYIVIAWTACDEDLVCSLLCRASGWYCPAAIVAACVIHCNT